jgi:hypothetical protein
VRAGQHRRQGEQAGFELAVVGTGAQADVDERLERPAERAQVDLRVAAGDDAGLGECSATAG